MPKTPITHYPMLALVGITALSAVACGSATKTESAASSVSSAASSAASSVAAGATTSAAEASQVPVIIDGEEEVSGSIASVAGTRVEVSSPKGAAAVAFTESTKVMELTPVTLAGITPGLCVTVRPGSGAEGGTVVADAVVIGANSGGECKKTNSQDNAGLPRSPLGGFRGTVDSVTGTTIALTTYGADGSKTNTSVETNDLTIFADRHQVKSDAVVEGKCIIARGVKDTGGVLQVDTINLPLVVNGECPGPKS